MSWIQTRTGKAVDFINPDPDTIDPYDIAYGLSMQCRFKGHVKEFYSVAQHCTLMSSWNLFGPKHLRLLHDAAEAYIGDLPKPLKEVMPEFKTYENRLMEAICKRFSIDYSAFEMYKDDIKYSDEIMLATEKRDLMEPEPKPWGLLPPPHKIHIYPSGPKSARWEYLRLLAALNVHVPTDYEVTKWVNYEERGIYNGKR